MIIFNFKVRESGLLSLLAPSWNKYVNSHTLKLYTCAMKLSFFTNYLTKYIVPDLY